MQAWREASSAERKEQRVIGASHVTHLVDEAKAKPLDSVALGVAERRLKEGLLRRWAKNECGAGEASCRRALRGSRGRTWLWDLLFKTPRGRATTTASACSGSVLV